MRIKLRMRIISAAFYSTFGELVKRARETLSGLFRAIRECDSTLSVGLTGTVRNLLQKSTGLGPPFLTVCFPP